MINKAPSNLILHHEIQKRKLLWVGTKYYLGMFPLHQITGIQRSVEKCLARERLCKNLLKLSQYFNCIHFVGGYPVEPVDLHPSTRHLDVLYDKLTVTDKAPHAYSLGKEG